MMAKIELLPAERPGVFIAEELEARGWTQADLAFVLGCDKAHLNRVMTGQLSVTAETALQLEDAFDVPAEFFANLQRMHDLGKAERADPGVKRRAGWANVFPVREMVKRGWIDNGDSDLLDLQMIRYFGKTHRDEVPFVSDAPVFAHAAKKSSSYELVSPLQYVWLHRVRQIAKTIAAPEYDKDALTDALPALRAHFIDNDDLAHIPALMLRCGVRLVLVEAIPGAKIDGVCLWIDDQPVIGITNRLDRLDNLCFVLRHEIEHILNGDGKDETFAPIDVFDASAFDDKIDECEKIANAAAAEFCVPQQALHSFVQRKAPYITEKDMLRFAAMVEINPSVAVGQIRHKTGKYNFLQKYSKSIRASLLEWPFIDGWKIIAKTEL
jgi:HTH-type transcriptional regulator/antitoxin HigA